MRLIRASKWEASVGASQSELAKQRGCPRVEGGISIAASFLCQRRCDETFAHASWAENEDVFVVLDPARLLRQRPDYAFVQAAGGAEVDIFHTAITTQLGIL
jgi:hypothetical protein